MTKKDFIRKLRAKLHALSRDEVDEIINEYSDHIAHKIADGKSEAEAIKDFGDIDELAKDILSAYHIERNPKTVEDYISSVVEFINEVTGKIIKFDSSQLVSFLVEFVILLVILGLIRWACELLVKGLGGVLGIVSLGVFAPLSWLLYFLFSVIYFIVAVYIIYLFIKRKFLDESASSEKPKEEVVMKEKTEEIVKGGQGRIYYATPENRKTVKKDQTEAPKAVVEEAVVAEEKVAEEVVVTAVVAEQPKAEEPKKKEEKPKSSTSNNSANDLLMTLFRLVIGIFIWLPAFCVLLVSLVLLGIVISLVVVTGFSFIWLLLIVFGGILICLAFVLPLSKLIWRKI